MTTARMLMHPLKPELDGKSLTDCKDSRGKLLFVEMVEAANFRLASAVSSSKKAQLDIGTNPATGAHFSRFEFGAAETNQLN